MKKINSLKIASSTISTPTSIISVFCFRVQYIVLTNLNKSLILCMIILQLFTMLVTRFSSPQIKTMNQFLNCHFTFLIFARHPQHCDPHITNRNLCMSLTSVKIVYKIIYLTFYLILFWFYNIPLFLIYSITFSLKIMNKFEQFTYNISC